MKLKLGHFELGHSPECETSSSTKKYKVVLFQYKKYEVVLFQYKNWLLRSFVLAWLCGNHLYWNNDSCHTETEVWLRLQCCCFVLCLRQDPHSAHSPVGVVALCSIPFFLPHKHPTTSIKNKRRQRRSHLIYPNQTTPQPPFTISNVIPQRGSVTELIFPQTVALLT